MEEQKIYTGYGDKGYTKNASGLRTPKYDAAVELIGCLDEAAAYFSIARLFVTDKGLVRDVDEVSARLRDICAEAAGGQKTVTDRCVGILEAMIDRYQKEIGGFESGELSKPAAMLNVARTAVRRADRAAAKAGQFGRLSPQLLAYLNRLCDLADCFVRYQSSTGKKPAAHMEQIDFVKFENGKLDFGLEYAKKTAAAVEQRARAMGLNVVVAIVDSSANIMLLHSMDDAYIASAQIAQDKAYTAAALKMPTHIALELSRGGALDGLMPTSLNRILLLGGGFPIKIGGKLAGGIGVSGGTADEDIGLSEYGSMYAENMGK